MNCSLYSQPIKIIYTFLNCWRVVSLHEEYELTSWISLTNSPFFSFPRYLLIEIHHLNTMQWFYIELQKQQYPQMQLGIEISFNNSNPAKKHSAVWTRSPHVIIFHIQSLTQPMIKIFSRTCDIYQTLQISPKQTFILCILKRTCIFCHNVITIIIEASVPFSFSCSLKQSDDATVSLLGSVTKWSLKLLICSSGQQEKKDKSILSHWNEYRMSLEIKGDITKHLHKQ